MSTTQAIRFGILGSARIARRIIAEMQSIDDIDVIAIASRDPARARWCAGQYGIPRSFPGYDELLACDEVDAVYVPLPPSLHAQWACNSLQAGKHVLVEKPVAVDFPSLKAIAATASMANVHWLDATAWLHHERTQRIGAIINSGGLGNLRHVSVACSFYEPFQSEDHRLQRELGGGCLLDLGWYAFGLAAWVAGTLPVRMQSIGRVERDVWFRCSSLLQFPDDLTAAVNCAYDTASRKWFEIAGDEASLVCDDFTRPWQGKPARFWVHDRAGKVTTEEFTGNQEAWMLRSFCQQIRNDCPDQTLHQQAFHTQRLCDLIRGQLEQDMD